MAQGSDLTLRRLAGPVACRALGATLLVGLAAVACDSGNPTGPPALTLVRLDLAAPRSIAPGESVQLRVDAVRSDNSVENVSGQALWRSSDREVLDISSSGVARGVAAGEVFISVSHGMRTASASAIVLPAGTYRLRGTVVENGIALAGATVTVLDGNGAGLSATSDASGRYALYGVGGQIRLQARSTGYLDQIVELDLHDHRTFDFDMRLERSRTDLRGTYTLTFERACLSSEIPRTRSYAATVTQEGSRLSVVLSGADFVVTSGWGNAFGGAVDGADHVTFALGSGYHQVYGYYNGYHYDLIERISDTRVAIISGTVTASLSPRGISGTLDGHVALAAGSRPPFSQIVERCHSAAHPFQMVRRE